jgi:hypothetical protein
MSATTNITFNNNNNKLEKYLRLETKPDENEDKGQQGRRGLDLTDKIRASAKQFANGCNCTNMFMLHKLFVAPLRL